MVRRVFSGLSDFAQFAHLWNIGSKRVADTTDAAIQTQKDQAMNWSRRSGILLYSWLISDTMRNYLSRRNTVVLSILGGLVFLGIATVAIWRAERALGVARGEQLQGADLGVDVSAVAPLPNPGFEAIGAPAVFHGVVEYDGRLYLSGPQGLSVYDSNGQLEKIYRVGIELPPAPLGGMTVGVLTGARRPEVLIATEGAGVLAFDGAGFREIAGKTRELRTVTALLPLASGRLLIGTEKLGVLIFDGKTLKPLHPTLNNIYVTALAGDESGLWVGTLNDGLLIWRGSRAITNCASASNSLCSGREPKSVRRG